MKEHFGHFLVGLGCGLATTAGVAMFVCASEIARHLCR